jgi:hypothetical protein
MFAAHAELLVHCHEIVVESFSNRETADNADLSNDAIVSPWFPCNLYGWSSLNSTANVHPCTFLRMESVAFIRSLYVMDSGFPKCTTSGTSFIECKTDTMVESADKLVTQEIYSDDAEAKVRSGCTTGVPVMDSYESIAAYCHLSCTFLQLSHSCIRRLRAGTLHIAHDPLGLHMVIVLSEPKVRDACTCYVFLSVLQRG